jgi:Fe-coproporphyrin III synthase
LSAGIAAIKSLDEDFPVSSRSVVHRLNYRTWSNTVRAAKKIGVDSISFLPADVSSQAFNRKEPWEEERQQEVLIPREELEELNIVIENLLRDHEDDFASGFIVESREKIRRIGVYYHAAHGLTEYPFKSCNAPWISAVVEPDGNVRPCFFHPVVGNIREDSLHAIVNNPASMNFRNELDMNNNDTCKKCVCSINLPCHKNPLA